MIDASTKLARVLLAAAVALVAACSVDAGGQIPCADDSSCPNEFPVCSAGKCIAGTATPVAVTIVGVEGHAAADTVRQTVTIDVTARSASGIAKIELASGTTTFQPKTSAAPLFTFEVDTTLVNDGAHDFTATVTPGDGAAKASAPFTLHVDNTPPAITAASGSGAPVVSQANASAGTSVTVDFRTSEASTVAATASNGPLVVPMGEVNSGTAGVRRVAFSTAASTALGTWKVALTAIDAAGNSASVTDSASTPLKFNVVAAPQVASFSGPASVGSGGSVTLSYDLSGGTGVITGSAGTGLPVSGISAAGSSVVTAPAVIADTTVDYTLTVTNAAGATDHATVSVLVLPAPSASLVFTTDVSGAVSSGSAINVDPHATVFLKPTFAGGGGSLNGAPVTSGAVVTVANVAQTTTYTLTVTNPAGVSTPASATATVNAKVTAFSVSPLFATNGVSTTFTFTASHEGGGASGTAPGTITGPGAGAGVSIASGTATQKQITTAINVNGTATWTLTVLNSAGVAESPLATTSVMVVAPPSQPTVTPGSSEVTSGDTGLTASVVNHAGYTYQWTASSGTITAGATTSSITWTAPVNASATPATVILSCSEVDAAGTVSAAGTAQVRVWAPPSQPAVTTPFNSVAAASTGNTASVVASPNMTYAWSITNGTITSAGGAAGVTSGGTNSITYTVTGAAAASVVLSAVETNPAGVSSSAGTKSLPIVNGPAQPVITPSASTVTAGATGFTASVAAQAGVTFDWTISNGAITAGQGTNNITFTAGAAGTPLNLNVTATQTATGASSAAAQVAVAVAGVPKILVFSPAATAVTNGGTTTFSYAITGGDCATLGRCRISGTGFTFDIPSVNNDGLTHTSSALTPPSSATTIYTLTVINATGTLDGTVSQTTTIQAVPLPTASLTASAKVVAKGQTVTFTPVYSGAVSTYIADPFGTHVFSNPLNNTATTPLTVGATATYTLVATNLAGASASASVTVTVLNTISATGITSEGFGATATLLNNGQVLIAGGASAAAGFGTNTAVLYDPISGTYTATGTMFAARRDHTAHLLTNGQVLLIGGSDAAGTPLDSLEVYTPSTGTFAQFAITGGASAGVMAKPHAQHTSTVLANGTVLVAGGCTTSVCTTANQAEIINVGAASTGGAITMKAAHVGATGTLLGNGNVLIAGGSTSNTGSGTDFGELFNGSAFICPGTSPTTCATRNAMTTARADHGAILLPNGQVALFGGKDSTGVATSTIELFDPAAANNGQFNTNTATLGIARFRLQATQLAGAGRILISGGFTSGTSGSTTLDLFSVSGTILTAVTPIDSLMTPRGAHTATLLFGGTALISGGAGTTTAGEIFSSAQ